MSLPTNPAGGSYGPDSGAPNLYPPGHEHLRPTNTDDKSPSLAPNNMDTPLHKTLYAQGLEMRKKVVGEDYVANSLSKNSSDFTRPLVQFATESAWGTIWTRPGLSLRDRSLLNLVMLTALGKWIELGTHVRGAVRNGATEVEIREALLQASAYCGMPAGMEAFRVADRVLNEMAEKGEMVRG
ncbi:related to uncharacterized homolog of gamma-carboxymuconolactone decarboxylase subunit [Phialocephala subalpina]|uniref:Related to uncharacterized homolog of gamma-carboxymuconolactone decarboxylase subunit n=1 Tax=Phialocephala subalpina TaxID=576137 RepID=A0A1L7WEI6_9HELO|nr:related to uncharacterized homolog of gamma-carboxymuconolactone decarboxylase subunit [Phialocephala subalpina]